MRTAGGSSQTLILAMPVAVGIVVALRVSGGPEVIAALNDLLSDFARAILGTLSAWF